jgi:plasmid stabilization system protein ParE
MAKTASRKRNSHDRDLERAELRARTLLYLDAFDREEPSERWKKFRELAVSTNRLSDLRALAREFRSFLGAMSPSRRIQLERELHETFGSDAEQRRDGEVVANVRHARRIKSEREHRIVQTHLDSLPPDPDADAEIIELGALLDEFRAAPTPRAIE